MLLTNLPEAIFIHCMSFIGSGNFLFVAGVCRSFRTIYISFLEQQDPPKPKTTTMNEVVSSIPRLQLVINERHIDVQNITIEWRGKSAQIWTVLIKRATYNGNLDVLVWMKTKTGMAWIRRYCHNGPSYSFNDLCIVAAKGGQLKVLQWLRSEAGGKIFWDAETCRTAAENGHFDFLKWAHQNGCPWDASTCAYAALKGHLKVLKWAHENDCPWDTRTCSDAAFGGNLEVLKWARQNGCPWDVETCSMAAKNGHLELLKWAHQNDCPWNKGVCSYAALNGHLEMLKWAHQNGCPWDEETLINAAKNCHIEVLEWAAPLYTAWYNIIIN